MSGDFLIEAIMAKDPAFLFYYQDFLVGTSFLTLEEVGAYIKLLCFLADKERLSEEQILKKIPAHIWDSICCKFEKDETGYFNRRLRTEVEKRKNYTESRRKNLHMSVHMTTHMKPHMENENEDINEKEIAVKDKKDYSGEIEEIVNDLNSILQTSYRTSSKKTRESIQARLKEGYTIDDFKKVHRTMVRVWGTDSKMVKYLRPETLYSPKFESYLNMKEPTTKPTEAGVKAYHVGQAWLRTTQEKELSNGKE
jgi:uncharacterized phage protein (TIGR02220 family)